MKGCLKSAFEAIKAIILCKKGHCEHLSKTMWGILKRLITGKKKSSFLMIIHMENNIMFTPIKERYNEIKKGLYWEL